MNEQNPNTGTPESAAHFRAALVELGETQSSFARKLKRLGDDRDQRTILRHVQRMATGDARISGPMHVVLNIFLRRQRRDQRARQMPAAMHPTLCAKL